MFVFEEWESRAEGRIKSIIILLMSLALILCFRQTENYTAADSMSAGSTSEDNIAEGEYSAGIKTAASMEQYAEPGIDLAAWLTDNMETADRQKMTQAWLDNCEQDFSDMMEEMAAANQWSAQYVQTAKESYLCFAEAMSWAEVYFLEESEACDDLLTEKAYHKAKLIYRQVQELEELLVE